jgi:RND family efflux transporter MFP subunit
MKRLTAIVVFGCAVGGAAACRTGTQESATASRQPVSVTAAPVVAMESAERLEAGGVVTAPQTATLSSRMVASIGAVRVKAGDRVRAGDVLVSLEAGDVVERTNQARAGTIAAEKALAEVRTGLAAAAAEQRLASAWHGRIVTLHARKSATDHERDEAIARLAAADARVAAAQASIELAEANLGAARAAVDASAATEAYTAIRAPFSGLVVERLTDPGNLAAPGVPLLRLDSDGARQAIGRVDEARAAFVHPGDRVEVEIGAANGGVDAVEGVVAEVARAVAADQRAFTIKVTLPQAVTARSGTFARLVFRGDARRVLTVPPQAVHRAGQVSSVFVVEGGVARLRLVQTGAMTMAGLEILAGVDEGESVVTSAAGPLIDGTPVVTGAAGPSGGARR